MPRLSSSQGFSLIGETGHRSHFGALPPQNCTEHHFFLFAQAQNIAQSIVVADNTDKVNQDTLIPLSIHGQT